MDPLKEIIPVSRNTGASLKALRGTNPLAARYGLTLTEEEIQALCRLQTHALKDTGRIAFGEGVYPRLVYAFCDSPYLRRETYADTLGELCALFYHLKSESAERWSDEELVTAMKDAYDGTCQGSLEQMADRVLSAVRGEEAEAGEEAGLEEE